jgi:hypothetical protein
MDHAATEPTPRDDNRPSVPTKAGRFRSRADPGAGMLV